MKNKDIPRRNYKHIEFILRMEMNKLEQLKMANVSNINKTNKN